MRIVGYRVKCDKIIVFSTGTRGNCLIKDKILEQNKGVKCSLDENCRMLERFRKFISRYTSL